MMGREITKIPSIILAKGESQGFPKKNMRLLCGKPLVWWTIQAAKKAKYVDRIAVSSDCDEILSLAKSEGAEPVRRPALLAMHDAVAEDAILHVLDCWRDQDGFTPDAFILLQPTSPLRDEKDLDAACEVFLKNKSSGLISGFEPEKNLLKGFKIDEQGYLRGLVNDRYPFCNRQDMPITFYSNGAIFIVDTKKFRENECLLVENTEPFFMKGEKNLDIDNLEQLQRAEKYLNEKIKNMHNQSNSGAEK